MEKLILGDCLNAMKEIESNTVDVIVTSPPYNKKGLSGGKVKPGNQVWKKFNIDYSTYDDDLTEEEYSNWMVEILNEMMRIIKPDGSIFVILKLSMICKSDGLRFVMFRIFKDLKYSTFGFL